MEVEKKVKKIKKAPKEAFLKIILYFFYQVDVNVFRYSVKFCF
jgi:hypothetical protein